jgi:hypothetical protein
MNKKGIHDCKVVFNMMCSNYINKQMSLKDYFAGVIIIDSLFIYNLFS